MVLFCYVEPRFVMRILLFLAKLLSASSLARVDELEMIAYIIRKFFLTEFSHSHFETVTNRN